MEISSVPKMIMIELKSLNEISTPTFSARAPRKIPASALSSWAFYFAVSAVSFFCSTASLLYLAISSILHVITVYLMVTCGREPGYLATGAKEHSMLRYCEHCSIYQPLRSRHCHDCQRCVATFDHHCFWIGSCVGERNHRVFLLMLLSSSATVIWDMAQLIQALLQSTQLAPWLFALCSASIALLSLPVLIVCTLSLYHIYLVVTCQTTWEHLSRYSISYLQHVPSSVRLFSQGFVNNIYEFCKRGSAADPIEWTPRWREGDKVPFDVFDNDYWNCC